MTPTRTLAQLQPGQSGVIRDIGGHQETANKLMQIGLVPGETVKVLRLAPLGGPMDIEIMSYRLAIRRADAAHIHLC